MWMKYGGFLELLLPKWEELGKVLNQFSVVLQSSQLHQPEAQEKGLECGLFSILTGCEWPLPKGLWDLFPLLQKGISATWRLIPSSKSQEIS